MITTKGKVTFVEFARANKKGTIFVNAKKNYILLREMCNSMPVGTIPNEGDYNELPTVKLDFKTIESIDVMIRALECIKQNLTPPPIDNDCYALAC